MGHKMLNSDDSRYYPGIIGGKTGYTSKAGYCYVGAFEQGGIRMIAVVLASGWPPNKTYKWSDVRALAAYGTEHYEYREIQPDTSAITKIPVTGGIRAYVKLNVEKKKVKNPFEKISGCKDSMQSSKKSQSAGGSGRCHRRNTLYDRKYMCCQDKNNGGGECQSEKLLVVFGECH